MGERRKYTAEFKREAVELSRTHTLLTAPLLPFPLRQQILRQ